MKKCKIQLVSELETGIEVKAIAFVPKEKKKYKRTEKKKQDKKLIEKEMMQYDD